MLKWNDSFLTDFTNVTAKRKPDFENLKKVLACEASARPTLFEFFLNDTLYTKLAGVDSIPTDLAGRGRVLISAYRAAGYDYCTVTASAFAFPNELDQHGKKSRSMSEGAVITCRDDYDAYKWPEPADFYDPAYLDELAGFLPDGMKLIIHGPCGVLENVMQLTGYEDLCYLLADDPDLVREIFDNVGSRLVKYYELAAGHDSVGACISNDDWGFNTQTMLSTADMRKYVFPWHKKIVETIHAAGRPALLHSCGRLDEVYDDIIDDMRYDGKHSFEDAIEPIEEAYERLTPKIALLGGIDVDFVCRSTPEEVYNRSCKMLEQSAGRGGFALGTGNSVPAYVPHDGYIAMICAAIYNG
ncbi:MAG: hypothetical protein FWH02_02170 [Oscillospiraceae bacterium]|nr:hypothetical protein [Oscillospiraceae bacterium]